MAGELLDYPVQSFGICYSITCVDLELNFVGRFLGDIYSALDVMYES